LRVRQRGTTCFTALHFSFYEKVDEGKRRKMKGNVARFSAMVEQEFLENLVKFSGAQVHMRI